MRRTSSLISARFLLFLFLFETRFAFARGGGGHTSGGGGHSSGGGGFGGGHSSGFSGSGFGGGMVGYGSTSGYGPSSGSASLGTFLFILFLVFIIYFLINGRSSAGVDRASALLHRHDFDSDLPSGSVDLNSLRTFDPSFSRPSFFDFAYALFSKAHQGREKEGLGLPLLSPYLAPKVIEKYRSLSKGVKEVNGVLVSGTHLQKVLTLGEKLELHITFDGNYTETFSDQTSQSWYTEETWVLRKKKGILSKPPAKIAVLNCPACGAPPKISEEGKCGSCGSLITTGDFDWFVEEIQVRRHQTPPLLDQTVEEVGTDLPTRFDEGFAEYSQDYQAKHPDFKWTDFKTRVTDTYFALQKSWTERKWESIRPFETENIFQTHLYWIEEYKKQRRINALRDVELLRIEPVKIEEDQYFESITARIYGRMIDYTVNSDTNQLICGDTRRPRVFSEYWTFIRTHQSAKQNKKQEGCPSCGAPLKINQSGRCEYCTTLVTSGNYDWVLSQIEQDENYL